MSRSHFLNRAVPSLLAWYRDTIRILIIWINRTPGKTTSSSTGRVKTSFLHESLDPQFLCVELWTLVGPSKSRKVCSEPERAHLNCAAVHCVSHSCQDISEPDSWIEAVPSLQPPALKLGRDVIWQDWNISQNLSVYPVGLQWRFLQVLLVDPIGRRSEEVEEMRQVILTPQGLIGSKVCLAVSSVVWKLSASLRH